MLNNWLKLSKKVLESNFELLKRPYKLTYVVTKECHSKCLNCDIWKVKPHNELTLDEVIKIAKNSPFFSWIDFTGGEPTDRKDFVELVSAFIEHCPDLLLIHFPTNGLKPKRIEEACKGIISQKKGKLVVSVSLDGPPELNDKLRGIPGDFKRVIETYGKLQTLKGMEVYIGMTLYPDNVALLEETYESIAKEIPNFKYQDLHVNLPHMSEHYYENSETFLKASEDMGNTIKQLMRLRGIPKNPFEYVERLYHKRVEKYIKTGECPQDCASLLSSCFLSENGTIFPCALWNEPMGNIRDHGYSFVPILESEKKNELRKKILAKDCPNCWTPCEAYQTLFANAFKLN